MKNKILLIIIVVAFSFTNCTKFLEVEATDAVGENIIFSSVKNIDANVVGMYAALNYYYGTEGYRWILGPDIMGQDVIVTSASNYSRLVFLYNYNVTPESSRAYALWSRSYRVIKSANDIVNKIDGAKGDQKDKDKLKGEALVLRAYTHLVLIRLFGERAYSQDPNAKGIVIDLKSDPNEAIGRSTVKIAYDQIVKDLETAIPLLEVRPSAEKWRMDKNAAYAILARTYLDMENWAKAASNANLARGGITDGSDLMDEATYLSGFNTTTEETIWERAYIQGQTHSFLSVASFTFTADQTNPADDATGAIDNSQGAVGFVYGYNTVRVTKSFANMFTGGDYRAKMFPKTPSGKYYTHFTREGALFTKYSHASLNSGRNTPRIRKSEMYLIEAEAHLEGAGGNATALLNAVQTARGATNTPGTIDNILTERRKELFAEGHAVYDLKRRHLPLNRTDTEHWTTEAKNLPAGDYRFNLPIPLSEINANPAISIGDQNRGYK